MLTTFQVKRAAIGRETTWSRAVSGKSLCRTSNCGERRDARVPYRSAGGGRRSRARGRPQGAATRPRSSHCHRAQSRVGKRRLRGGLLPRRPRRRDFQVLLSLRNCRI